MYNIKHQTKTSLRINTAYEGERIEQKIARIVNNKEPITDGAPIIYTDRKDGVKPEYNIRTDRWEIAIDAMDVVSKTNTAKRNFAVGERTFDTMGAEAQKEHIQKYPQSRHNKGGESKT